MAEQRWTTASLDWENAPLTWPTAEECQGVLELIEEARHHGEMMTGRVRRLLDDNSDSGLAEGAPPATFADIGVLEMFCELASMDVRSLSGYLAEVAQAKTSAIYRMGDGGREANDA